MFTLISLWELTQIRVNIYSVISELHQNFKNAPRPWGSQPTDLWILARYRCQKNWTLSEFTPEAIVQGNIIDQFLPEIDGREI